MKVELIGAILTQPLKIEGAEKVVLRGNHHVCPQPSPAQDSRSDEISEKGQGHAARPGLYRD